MTCTSAPMDGDSLNDEPIHNGSAPALLILHTADDTPSWQLEPDHINPNLDQAGPIEHSVCQPRALHWGPTSPQSWSASTPLICEQERFERTEPRWVPTGPGWFDSSWLLRQGLEVREIESLSALDSRLDI